MRVGLRAGCERPIAHGALPSRLLEAGARNLGLVRIPQVLASQWGHELDWLARLPQLASECAELWDLELEEPVETAHSLVVPAGAAVLKLNAPSHYEADHEADALERWAGRGAAQLLARDDSRRAFLIERCRPGTRLWDAGVDEPAVVAELLRGLWREPEEPHPFRLLANEADRWADEVSTRYELGGRPFEPTLLDFTLDVFRSVDREAAFLANQDLHGGNVLRAEREPWLLIDPKPLVGERELDGVGLLRNAILRAGSTSNASIRRWLDLLEGLGLDRERLRGWGVAHALAWGWDRERRWSPVSIAVAQGIHVA
jgi:streptomycin 6-kinase